MTMHSSRKAQRGAALLVGMIVLVLITLFVVSSFTMSTSNLKAVGNTQFRDEAIAAANFAIEQVISTDFTTAPVATVVNVDIDGNNVADYFVNVAVPTCIQAVPIAGSVATLSGVSSGVPGGSEYNTVWELVSTVNSAATGAAVTVRQGVRRRLTQPQYLASACV